MNVTGYVLGRTAWRVLRTLVLVCVLAFGALPLYWMVQSSFVPTSTLIKGSILPRNLTLDNYRTLLTETKFPLYLANSVVVAVGVSVVTVVLASLAAYGLARFEFRGRLAVARLVLVTYMFPSMAIAIPLYVIFFNLGLANSRIGLIIAHSSTTLPFCIWFMTQAFRAIPRSYQESSFSMGAGSLRTLLQVEAPMARASIVAVAIFSFALSWEDYTMSFILTTEGSAQTLPVGTSSFIELDIIQWGLVQSSAALMAVPPMIIILFMQRFLLKGLGTGGIKG